jgi:putative transcriptional regulator
MFDKDVFTKRLKLLMEKKGIKQNELAKAVEISANTINSLCKGKYKIAPSLDNIYKIAKYFDVNVAYLLGEIDFQESIKAVCTFLKKYQGLSVTLPDEKPSSTNNYITNFSCIRDSQSKLFPRTPAEEMNVQLKGIEHIEKDTYCIVKGNIYRVTDTDYEHNHIRADTSVYDYVNEGNSLEPYIKAYKSERFSLGLLGALSANDFYFLCYIFGYWFYNKDIISAD